MIEKTHQYDIENLLQILIHHATLKNASDIHIEPYEQEYRIRLRIDGLLQHYKSIALQAGLRLINKIKTLANLDISEHRRPQDGRLKFKNKNVETNIRLSVCPVLNYEKAVLRLLKDKQHALSIEELGMLKMHQEIFYRNIIKKEGLILVTGPTGSGKTITLYSALKHLNTNERNLISIEDPIEIRFDGINQTQVNHDINLSFSTILRANLRQDPDIIMVGEIRDTETARITLRAAQTGHLVFSTLHCARSIDAILRLQQLANEQHIDESLKLIISQRLIRRLCQHCQGKSCKKCHQGFSGRSGIFEMLEMTPSIREIIKNSPQSFRKNDFQHNGFSPFKAHSHMIIKDGISTAKEIKRAI